MPNTQSRPITTRWQFDLLIFSLGIILMAANLAASLLIETLNVNSQALITVAGLLAISPVLIAFHLLKKRQKALEKDEYQQALLLQQALFTSLWSIGMASFFGFYFYHSGESGSSMPYFIFGLCWFIMWPMAALVVKDKA